MKNKMNKLDTLKDMLEQIRSNKHPDIPHELIESILEVQMQYPDEPNKAMQEIKSLIKNHILGQE